MLERNLVIPLRLEEDLPTCEATLLFARTMGFLLDAWSRTMVSDGVIQPPLFAATQASDASLILPKHMLRTVCCDDILLASETYSSIEELLKDFPNAYTAHKGWEW